MPQNPDRGQWEYTPLGRILNIIGAPERAGVSAVLRPVAEAIDPSIKPSLERLEGDVYAADVFNAMFPPSDPHPSPLEKGGRFIAGAALGAPFDPLTYVTGGGLGSRTIRKGIAKSVVGKTAQATGRAIQSGHAAERLVRSAARAAPVLDKVRLPELARFWDSATTNVSQKFGFNIGADPWFSRTHQELFSNITGAGKLRAGQVVDDLEPALEAAARKFAVGLDMSEQDAYVRLKAAVNETTEMHPYIELAKDAHTAKLAVGVGKVKTPYEKSRAAIINNFGLPPSWGGPGEMGDTDLIRQVRHMALTQRRQFSNQLLEMDRDRLGHDIMLHTHPDQGYGAHIMGNEGKSFIEDYNLKTMKHTLVGGRGRRGRPYATPPSTHTAHELARTLRVIDPLEYQNMKASGVFQPFKVPVVTRAGKRVVRTIDPIRHLEPQVGGVTSKRTMRLIERMADAGMLSWDRAADNYVGKLVPSMSGADANRWIWENGHGIIPARTVRNFFETDPTVIDVARGMASDRAMLSKEWFDAVKTRPDLVRPVLDPEVPSDWIEIKGIPELQGYSVRPDEAKYLRNVYEADINLGPSLKKALKVLNVANQSFKAWALSIFPSYHTRNFVGAGWNYYLGSDNPVDAIANIKRSAGAWKAIKGGRAIGGATKVGAAKTAQAWKLKGTVNPATKKPWTAGEIWTEVQKRNGWGVGFISPENTQDLKRQIHQMKRWGVDDPAKELLRGAKADWKAQGRKGKPYIGPPPTTMAEKIALGFTGKVDAVERGFRIGSHVDDRWRMAHVIQRLNMGDTMDDAVRSMKKHFFDYHQLSPFEKQWMKTALPFYAWSRKNIPFQLEMLIRRPDRLQRFHGGLQGWEGSEQVPEDEKYLNEWMRKNFSVRIRKNQKGQHEYFAFKNWLPLMDIAELFHGWEWLTQGLTPWVKVPIEYMTNFNTFTDRNIDHLNSVLGGERTRFGTLKGIPGFKGTKGVEVPNKMAHILKSIRLPATLHAVLDNPQNLDMYSQIAKVVAGRTYPLDPGRARYHFARELRELNMKTKKAIRSALFKGEDRESVDRLVETYLKKRKALHARRGIKE